MAVSLNSAWQKTLSFNDLKLGDVNRAFESHETGGGKGTNVARVFRLMGWPVSVAAFVGGFQAKVFGVILKRQASIRFSSIAMA